MVQCYIRPKIINQFAKLRNRPCKIYLFCYASIKRNRCPVPGIHDLKNYAVTYSNHRTLVLYFKSKENNWEVAEMKGTTTYGNNDRLTERINRCKNPRLALALLVAILEPRINNIENTIDKSEVNICDVLPILNESKRH